MRRYRALVAISDNDTRCRLLAALRAIEGVEAEVADDLHNLERRTEEAGFLVFAQDEFVREGDPLLNRILTLRLRATVLVAYKKASLLEAASVFGAVDGWISLDRLDETLQSRLVLAREHYAVLPLTPDSTTGLDSIRRARLAALPLVDRRVVCRVARGDTNAEIARRLNLTEEQVGGAVRRSLRRLCLERRLQTGVLIARLIAARRAARKVVAKGNR